MMTSSLASILRRRLVSAVFASGMAALLLPGGTQAAPENAGDTIRQFYDVLLSTMQSGQSLGEKGRYERLQPVIGQIFDIPYMTREVIGPTWGSLSEAQKQQVTGAFYRYVAASYADRFSNYSGQKLLVTGEQPRGSSVVVDSEIVRSEGKPVVIKYMMRRSSDAWRVADIYVAGTISELATRRAEFSSILQRQGIDSLTAMLNDKAATLLSSAAR